MFPRSVKQRSSKVEGNVYDVPLDARFVNWVYTNQSMLTVSVDGL